MPRVDRQRRQDRQDVGPEVLSRGRLLSLVEVGPSEDADPRGGQLREEVADEAGGLLLLHGLHRRPDLPERLGGQPVVLGALQAVDCPLLPEARHADHEELVEVRLADGQELQPLEERPPGVPGLLDDPLVEGEPRQLPVQRPARRAGRGGGGGLGPLLRLRFRGGVADDLERGRSLLSRTLLVPQGHRGRLSCRRRAPVRRRSPPRSVGPGWRPPSRRRRAPSPPP